MGQTCSKAVDSCSNCCKRDKSHKRGKKKRKTDLTKTTKTQRATINSNWETLNQMGSLTPSQIPDDMLTREVHLKSPKRKESDEFEFDKMVLEKENYQVIDDSLIGKGGSGKVYKIKHKITGEILAAKVSELVKRKNISKPRFESFKNEIFILRRNPHKNIIELKDHFICDQTISFIIMEFANSGNLEEKLKSFKKPFPEEVAKNYFVQISNAIYYLHTKGIVHGDLKLPNVLLLKIADREVVKVTDFGCSRIVFRKDTGVVMKTKAVGTVSYMSPEQIAVYIAVNLKRPDLVKNHFKRYNPFKSDLWALGVCLYKLVNCHRPFSCRDKRDPIEMFEMFSAMKRGFQLKQSIYKLLSNDCIELMKGLLEFDRFKRIDIKVVYTTSWVINSKQYDPIGQNRSTNR